MVAEALIIGGVLELAKMGLVIWMQASQMANLTEAQKEKMFKDVKAEFDAKDAANLPEVPK